MNTRTTERLEFPYIIDVITKISEKYTVFRPQRSVTISMAVLLPVISLNEQHAEDFALYVQVRITHPYFRPYWDDLPLLHFQSLSGVIYSVLFTFSNTVDELRILRCDALHERILQSVVFLLIRYCFELCICISVTASLHICSS